MDLSGNTILITGGTSGIGRRLAEVLHDRGNTVIVAGRRSDLLAEAISSRPDLVGIELDVCDRAAIDACAREIARRFPALNVVFANAGVSRPEAVRSDPPDLRVAESIVETNILGTIRTAAAFLPVLLEQRSAALIATGSALAFVPKADFPTYCASKAFLHSWLVSVRHQLRGTPVDVLEILPPYVRTELTGPGQAADPRAMPVDQYVAEVLRRLEAGDHPGGEILLDADQPRRWAERDGRFAELFSAMNPVS